MACFIRVFTCLVACPQFQNTQRKLWCGLSDSAHRIESQLPTRILCGDMDRLVAHYRASDDPVFQSDADSLGMLMRREQMLDSQWQALQGRWYERAWHVFTKANPAILEETWQGYRYQVVLTPECIGWGLACAFLLSWIIEAIALALAVLIMPRRRPARRLV